ncbi:MAG: hypothetical protein Q9161_002160 [Pseudevernia consocians]
MASSFITGYEEIPPDCYKVTPGKLLPKHKGVIICFMYGTQAATTTFRPCSEPALALDGYAIHGAAQFIFHVYGLEIRGTAIRDYYCQTKKNAKDAGVKWDQDAVAHIICNQVQDQDTFDEVFSFLKSH